MTDPDDAAPHAAAPRGAGCEAAGQPLMVMMGPGFNALASGDPRPALFLDRDGVLNEDVCYVRRAEDVRVFPQIANVVALANRRSVPVVVVSNQSGVGRGYFGWSTVAEVHGAVVRQLARHGASVDLTLYAGSGPDGDPAALAFRKPKPGMLEVAGRLLPIDAERSVMIGDKWSDVDAADAAGLGAAILLGDAGREPTGGGKTRRLSLIRRDTVAAAAEKAAALLAGMTATA